MLKNKINRKPTPNRMSMLDAAALILKATPYSMSAKELIVLMEAENLWKSPAAKNPDKNLSSALAHEIIYKENSRFTMTGQGLFAFNHET